MSTRRAVLCSTCLQPLRRGDCPKHGRRNSDGSSPRGSKRRGKTFPPDVPTRADVMAVVGTFSTRAPTSVRNSALVVTGYRTGLRVSELIALRPKDLDSRSREVHVLHGKGDQRRSVPIDSDALAHVGRWLEVRRRLVSGHRPLFCTLTGRPLTPTYVEEMLHRHVARAGIDRRLTPHGLRHAFAYEFVMEGGPIPVLQKLLGHSDPSITARYIDHISAGELAKYVGDRSGWAEGS